MKALSFILAALVAQPFLSGPQGAAPGLAKPEDTPNTFRVVGIAASNEGRGKVRYDEMLEPYEAVFDSLEDSDTFKFVSQEDKEAPNGVETEFVINSKYRLYLRPSGQSETGNLQIETRIETDSPGGLIDAVRARGEMQPNRAITFADMPLDDGELVVILSLLPPPGEDQDQSPSNEEQDQQESEEQQEQQDQSNSDSQSQDDGEESDEQQEEMPEESEGEAAEQDQDSEESEGENGEDTEDRSSSSNATEAEEKLDQQNIDALLESLEEIDQEEQRAAHNNKKGKPRISGEWW